MREILPDTPLPSQMRFRKRTTVLAFRMNAETGATFHKSWGEQVCRKGDWVLVPLGADLLADGDLYGCEHTVFVQTYVPVEPPLLAGHHFRKRGLVKAARIHEPFVVHTLEGIGHGRPGDWVLENPGGDRYLNRHEQFLTQYEPVP